MHSLWPVASQLNALSDITVTYVTVTVTSTSIVTYMSLLILEVLHPEEIICSIRFFSNVIVLHQTGFTQHCTNSMILSPIVIRRD